jgi:hypothetical protein
MPCETAVGDDVVGWWDGVVVVVVWPSSWKREAWAGGLGQKPETGPLGLGLGHAVGNSGDRQWGEVVGGVDKVMAAVGLRVGLRKLGLRVLGPKARNQPTRARFGALMNTPALSTRIQPFPARCQIYPSN